MGWSKHSRVSKCRNGRDIRLWQFCKIARAGSKNESRDRAEMTLAAVTIGIITNSTNH